MSFSFNFKCVLFWGCLFFCSSNVFSQVKADFDATPISGCAPLLVSFKDISSGNPNYWMWDLGNGTTSFNQNSSTTYLTPGTYTVKLVVKNNNSEDSIIKEKYITVFASPTVQFSGTPREGCLPLNTQFTDNSTSVAGAIANWQWDFGDGENSTIQNPTHTYTAAGNFNVSLRVTSSEGCKASLTIPSFIQIDTPAIPQFTASEVNFCNHPANVQFINSTTGKEPLTYLWDFGDGQSSTAKSPAHTYNAMGDYTVSLTVTNATGCESVITKTNFIHIGEIKSSFELPGKICKGSPFIIKNTSSPIPSKVLWDFGDGTTSTVISPTKAFTSTGIFTIKLVTYFGDCKDSTSQTIEVMDNAKSSFTANQTVACQAPFTVNFSNTSTNATSFSWDFGDGVTDNSENPSHTYITEGEFTVTLITFNSSGCSDTLIKKNFIVIKMPQIVVNLPAKGCAPFTHTFNPTIIPANNIQEYFWEFGDGATSTQKSPTHTYNTPGRYDVKLTVTTTDGCRKTQEFPHGVIIGSVPNSDFTADKVEICANEVVTFTNLSSPEANEWIWSFGDGSTSTAKNPGHQYGDTGYFTVELVAIYDGCEGAKTISKYIHVKGPVANFSSIQNCEIPGQVNFTDNSRIPETWSWNFGDGGSSNLKNPMHVYASPGNYNVILTVNNSTTNCVSSITRIVRVIKETPDFTLSSSQTCKNSSITFTAVNSNPANISLYTWRFGDGVTRTSTSATYTYTYSKSGKYDVKLIITDLNGCKDSITKPFAIEINGPTSFFRATQNVICQGEAATFFDSSYSDNVSNIVQWEWNWGDGTSEILNTGPFVHTYSTLGNYTVSLTVSDKNGCTDKLVKLNEIIVPKVTADFQTDTLSCTSKLVSFQNNSFGIGLTYLWGFGDGTTSTDKNTQHLYNTEGTYSVSLEVKDENGCTAQIQKSNIVTIANPIADFSADVTYSYCPPLVTQFTNTSINNLKNSWNFGDSTSSTTTNPSHFYGSVGKFTATLTVTGAEGCESTKSIDIEVKGPTGVFTYDNLLNCLPLTSNFQAKTFENKKFVWDFNDGTTVATLDSNVSHTYTLPGKYLPKLILIDESDCHVPIQGTDTILVLGVTANFNSDTNLVCSIGDVAFQDSSISNDQITNYNWIFGDGGTSTQKNPQHTYTTEGKYFPSLSVITKEGCKDTLINKLEIQVNRKPIIDINGPDGACVPATITFTGIASNPDTSTLSWNWNFSNGNNSQIQNPVPQNFDHSGIFPIKATVNSTNGCSDTTTKNIEIYALPTLNVSSNNSIICKGNSTTLNVTGAQNYQWDASPSLSCTNCNNPIASPDTSTYYYVMGTSAKGCQSKDSILINVKQPFQISLSKTSDSLCLGSSVQLGASGAELFTWSPSAGLSSTMGSTVTATPQSTTVYQVIGSDSQNCFKDTGYIPITVFPIPTVSAGGDSTINVGNQISIIPTISNDVSNVIWSPTTGIISYNYPGIIVQPKQTTQYKVEVENQGGCQASDQIVIYVICNDANIFVPNTFSPNGDGMNDRFYPRGTGVFTIKSFKIFNRWGQQIFHNANFNANDSNAGWDGTINGQSVTPDVFVYVMEVVCENNVILTYKGDITLIK